MTAETLTLTLGAPANGGSCVARHDGRVVFVRYALPGETVTARITSERGSYWHAEAVEILEPSADRIASLCPIAGPHGAGCCDLAFAEHNLGLVAAATGDHPAARDHFTRAAAAYAATIGGDASGPIRLALDQARTDLALGDLARARTHAAHASDAARRADIAWIAAEADALTATLAPAKPATRPRPAPPVATSPVSRSLAPPPQPPPPKPRPDVGVYGSSQSW